MGTGDKRSMAINRNKFQASAAPATDNYPANYQWADDTQAMRFPTPAAYLQVTQTLAPKFLELGAHILIDAGFAKPAEKAQLLESLEYIVEKRRRHATSLICDGTILGEDATDKVYDVIRELPPMATIDKIKNALINHDVIEAYQGGQILNLLEPLPQKPSMRLDSPNPEIGGVEIFWRIKDVESAEKKLSDPSVNQDPANIGDYFGIKFVPDTLRGLIALRAASVNNSMTSRKCELSDPNEESQYRSHKSHNKIEQNSLSQTGEVIIIPKCMEDVDDLTHTIKEMERSLKKCVLDAAKIFGSDKVSSKLATCADELLMIRKFVNSKAAERTGLDSLVLPENMDRVRRETMEAARAIKDVSDYTTRMLDRVEERYPGVINDFMGIVAANASQIAKTSAREWGLNRA